MFPTKFRFICQLCFREEFQKSINQKQELPVAAMFVNESGRNQHSLQRTSIYASFHVSVHLTKRFQRRRFFRNRPIRNKNCLWQPCLLTNQAEMSNLYRGSSIDACYQVSVHWDKQFPRRRILRNQPIRNKNCLWWPCFFIGSGQNEQSLQKT